MDISIYCELIVDNQADKVPWDLLTLEDMQQKDPFRNTLMLYAAHHGAWTKVPKRLINDAVLLEKNPAGVCALDRIIQNLKDKGELKKFQTLLESVGSGSLKYLKSRGLKVVGKAAREEVRRRVRVALNPNPKGLEL